MQGEKSTEEQAMLERKISELQAELDRKRDDHTMLNSQTKQIESDFLGRKICNLIYLLYKVINASRSEKMLVAHQS